MGSFHWDLTRLAVAALAICLIAAGCRGDDDDAGDEPPRSEEAVAQSKAASKGRSGAQAGGLSKGEFISEANEICSQGNAELQAAAEERLGQGLATLEARDAFATETIVPNVRRQIGDIRALGIPEGDEDAVSGFLEEAEGILDQLKRAPESFSADPFAEVNQDFAAYGLTACGPPVGG